MCTEWEELSLREVGIQLLDCDHRTPVAQETGRPYIAIPQLRGGRIVDSDARLISEDDFVQWTRRTRPQAWDVVLSRRCNPGETAFVPPGYDFALGQNLVLLRSDGKRIFPPFLRWLLRTPAWWEQVRTFINVGAVFDSLKCADIPKFRLPVPPLREQHAIASILGALDGKIELNRRMNRTLEGMARAIFKSWFVDFDPVRAKRHARRGGAAGRKPPGLSPDIAALFPDSFEDSPLGPIPKGWKPGALGDVVDSPRRGVKPSDVPPTTPYIGLEHMPRRCIALDAWGRADEVASGKSQFWAGEILFGKLRPYFHKVGIAPVDGVCSTDIVVIAPKSEEWHGYVVSIVSSKSFVDYADSRSAGTKMPRTNWTDMGHYPLAFPPMALAKAFQSQVAALHRRIGVNVRQNRPLAGLRDTLLPKLLSGEIEVSAAEPIAERVQ